MLLNIPSISVTLSVFHLEISGNEVNEEHWSNIPFILVTLSVFQLEISGNEVNEEHWFKTYYSY